MLLHSQNDACGLHGLGGDGTTGKNFAAAEPTDFDEFADFRIGGWIMLEAACDRSTLVNGELTLLAIPKEDFGLLGAFGAGELTAFKGECEGPVVVIDEHEPGRSEFREGFALANVFREGVKGALAALIHFGVAELGREAARAVEPDEADLGQDDTTDTQGNDKLGDAETGLTAMFMATVNRHSFAVRNGRRNW